MQTSSAPNTGDAIESFGNQSIRKVSRANVSHDHAAQSQLNRVGAKVMRELPHERVLSASRTRSQQRDVKLASTRRCRSERDQCSGGVFDSNDQPSQIGVRRNVSASTDLLPKFAPQTTNETHRSPRSSSIVAAHDY